MATETLSIGYRPARIGFLVRDGNLADFRKAVGIATLLCGGMYDPIIPVGADSAHADRLIDLFDVDALCPVERDTHIEAVLQRYPDLYRSYNYAKDVFYINMKGEAASVGYLDVIATINRLWEDELKHKPTRHKSNAVLVTWTKSDPQDILFAAAFGFFPAEPELIDDFSEAFRGGLYARQVKIPKGAIVPATLEEQVTPIRWTAHDLMPEGGYVREPGVFVGNSSDCDDLTNFWNIRAAGDQIAFLPIDCVDRFEQYVKVHLDRVDELKSRWGNRRPVVSVYHRVERTEVDTILARFPTKKEKRHYPVEHVMRSGLKVQPRSFMLQRSEVLAVVDPWSGRFQITAALPEKKFVIGEQRVGTQHLMVTVRSFGETAYPFHTIIPPKVPTLNRIYSQALVYEPDKLKAEHDQIVLWKHVRSTQIRLYPIAHVDVIKAMFRSVGIEATQSQPGRLAAHIVEQLGGLHGGRIFKVSGVRTLLDSMSAQDNLTSSTAARRIWDHTDFSAYDGLYIEGGHVPSLDGNKLFHQLLEKNLFRAGLELTCKRCRLKNWIPLKTVDDRWICEFCGHDHQTSLDLRNRGDWQFRKSGLFAKDNNQEGAIPVILTLQSLLQISHGSRLLYATAMELKSTAVTCETDFVVVDSHSEESVSVAVGECKSAGGLISAQDAENLKKVWQAFDAIGVKCYLVFAKTSNGFTTEELTLFHQLDGEYIPLVLLTERELNRHSPYDDEKEEKLPAQHIFSLADMAVNSRHRYLSSPAQT